MRWPNALVAMMCVAMFAPSCGWLTPEKHAPRADNGLPLVEPAAAFVAEAREQAFFGTPTVEFEGSGPETDGFLPAEVEEFLALLRILGVIDSDESSIYRDEALAFRPEYGGRCCPVRVTPLSDPDLTAVIMVHELTHLLDQRHFDRLDPDTQTEDWIHLRAIVEGNATRIEMEYEDHLGGWLSLREALSADNPDGFVPAVRRVFDFAYIEGSRLAREIAEARGELGINRALREPPRSAEQVMFPQTYLDNEEPSSVPVPPVPSGQAEVRSGTIGTFLLMLVLEPALGEADATELVAEWSGDSYLLSEDGAALCLTAEIEMDDAFAAAGLADGLRGRFLFGITELDSGVRIDRCI